ncbi:MAG TPA: PIN domain-containing protein [Thermoanaerobaculia bacterium]|nr:PIN domain-containing protein [Thermoanaerobaculia bacterium]
MSDHAGIPFLDTSYLVRYLTNDLPDLAEQAAAVIDHAEALILSELALAETAHSLTTFYDLPRPRVVDALVEIVNRRNIRLLSLPKHLALEALALCRDSKRVSITDALLWAQARHAGAPMVWTFDRKFPELARTG